MDLESQEETKQRTSSDIVAKRLETLTRRQDLGADEQPLVFWLLAEYFRSDPVRFDTVGIFRVTSRADDVRTLERHLSRENWPFLETVESPHTVANYWKRVLADMPEPLVTFSLYEQLGQIEEISD